MGVRADRRQINALARERGASDVDYSIEDGVAVAEVYECRSGDRRCMRLIVAREDSDGQWRIEGSRRAYPDAIAAIRGGVAAING